MKKGLWIIVFISLTMSLIGCSPTPSKSPEEIKREAAEKKEKRKKEVLQYAMNYSQIIVDKWDSYNKINYKKDPLSAEDDLDSIDNRAKRLQKISADYGYEISDQVKDIIAAYPREMEKINPFVEKAKQIGRCKEHIELLSAKAVAKEYGKTEAWVVRNHKVNLWEKSNSQGKGRTVGEMLPGSRAVIIEKGLDSYKVISPLDKSVGWVSKSQVRRTLFQDTDTRESCKAPK